MGEEGSSMHDDSWHLQTGRLLRAGAVGSNEERVHGQCLGMGTASKRLCTTQTHMLKGRVQQKECGIQHACSSRGAGE